MKYIDANHLKAEIKERIALQKDLLKRAEDSARIEGSIDALLGLLNSLDTLSEEPDKDLEEVDLTEEINRYCGTRDVRPVPDFMETVARHFAKWQYQKDRAEFAKLKAKEWQDGYDDGYQRGLNARKEETK